MKKLLLSLGAVAAVVTPVAAVVACGEDSTTVTKAEVQKEFVADMAQVTDVDYSWVIEGSSALAKGPKATVEGLKTVADIKTFTTLDHHGNHAIVFADRVGQELASGVTSSYKWKLDGEDVTTVYKIDSFNIEPTDPNKAIGTIESITNGNATYYAYIATKETEGVLIDHDATGNFYYNTVDAFAKTADQIKITAKDDEHAIRLGSLTDAELVEAWTGALEEIGLTKPTA